MLAALVARYCQAEEVFECSKASLGVLAAIGVVAVKAGDVAHVADDDACINLAYPAIFEEF